MNSLNQHNKYIKGEMNERELDSFTKKILKKHHDDDLKSKWNKLLKDEHGYEKLTADEVNIAPVQDVNETVAPDSVVTKSTGKVRTMYRALAMAAGFLLLFSLYFFNVQPANSNTNQLAANYLSDPFPYGEMRKGDVEISEKRLLAGELYTQRVYDLSSAAYLEIVELNKGTDIDLFYLGLSELYNNDFQNAIIHFGAILKIADSQFKKDATWYLSLAHLKANNQIEAKNILSKIAQWSENSDARAYDKKIALQAKVLLKSME